ncbi:hypothetical protein LXA43DRAFT_305567 [Ganoderma leucocontextum]|nr:hypothetical protein LXA43DRAFT_305567 [Ganoderma leucocontextum]
MPLAAMITGVQSCSRHALDSCTSADTLVRSGCANRMFLFVMMAAYTTHNFASSYSSKTTASSTLKTTASSTSTFPASSPERTRDLRSGRGGAALNRREGPLLANLAADFTSAESHLWRSCIGNKKNQRQNECPNNAIPWLEHLLTCRFKYHAGAASLHLSPFCPFLGAGHGCGLPLGRRSAPRTRSANNVGLNNRSSSVNGRAW